MPRRCVWAEGVSDVYRDYHDREWGVPVYADTRLFEFLILEGAQAGLSWVTVLNKRAHYRVAFDGFDPQRVARFDRRRIARLLGDPGIVRNRLKIESAVDNARAFLDVQERHGAFAPFIWQFVGGRPRHSRWRNQGDVPATTPESEAMSRELKRLGFRFVGPTICYAFMQAVGMVNDHLTGCFRHSQVRGLAAPPGQILPAVRSR